MIDLILKMPEATDVTVDTPEAAAIREEMSQYQAVFTAHYLAGTQPVGGYKLVLATAIGSLTEIEASIAAFGLPWTVLHAQDADTGALQRQASAADLIPFLPDEATYDEAGNEVSRTRPTTADGLGVVSGHAPWGFAP